MIYKLRESFKRKINRENFSINQNVKKFKIE